MRKITLSSTRRRRKPVRHYYAGKELPVEVVDTFKAWGVAGVTTNPKSDEDIWRNWR